MKKMRKLAIFRQTTHIHPSRRRDKHPIQLNTYLLPYLVLLYPLLAVFQHREKRQELAPTQEFAQLIHRIIIIQEIDSVVGAKFRIGSLDFHKQITQSVLEVRRHHRWFNPQLIFNKWNVLVIFIKSQLLHNLFRFLIRELGNFNPLLLDLLFDAFEHILGNTRGLLRLELREDFAEMVDALIRVKTGFFRRLFIRRLLIVNQEHDLLRALITHHNTLTLYRNHLAIVAELAYISRVDIFRNIHIRLVNTRQILFNIIVLSFE